jgi:hypothetical protein
MEDMAMSLKIAKSLKARSLKATCVAAALAAAMFGFAGPAGAQYSGNSVLRNPGASTPTPTVRQGSTYVPRNNPNPYWRPGQLRNDMPGGGLNPSLRGTNTSPCPPSRPNCNPTQ